MLATDRFALDDWPSSMWSGCRAADAVWFVEVAAILLRWLIKLIGLGPALAHGPAPDVTNKNDDIGDGPS